MGDYWRVLWDAGKLTREKMAKFQSPITATPLYLPNIINGEITFHVSLASCRALVLLTALLPTCRFVSISAHTASLHNRIAYAAYGYLPAFPSSA